jgi:hypothetical protein
MVDGVYRSSHQDLPEDISGILHLICSVQCALVSSRRPWHPSLSLQGLGRNLPAGALVQYPQRSRHLKRRRRCCRHRCCRRFPGCHHPDAALSTQISNLIFFACRWQHYNILVSRMKTYAANRSLDSDPVPTRWRYPGLEVAFI